MYNKRTTNVQQMYNKRTANVQQTYIKCTTNVQQIYNKRTTNVQKCTTNVQQTYTYNNVTIRYVYHYQSLYTTIQYTVLYNLAEKNERIENEKKMNELINRRTNE